MLLQSFFLVFSAWLLFQWHWQVGLVLLFVVVPFVLVSFQKMGSSLKSDSPQNNEPFPVQPPIKLKLALYKR